MKAAASREESEERCEGKCVILDVGGEKFTALRQTLFRFPTSRYIMQSDLQAMYQ